MRPDLMIDPIGDAEFVASVDRARGAGAKSPEALADGLRARYPRIVVRPRSLSSETLEVWYV